MRLSVIISFSSNLNSKKILGYHSYSQERIPEPMLAELPDPARNTHREGSRRKENAFFPDGST